jgi:hypothetical protein
MGQRVVQADQNEQLGEFIMGMDGRKASSNFE